MVWDEDYISTKMGHLRRLFPESFCSRHYKEASKGWLTLDCADARESARDEEGKKIILVNAGG